MTTVTDTPEPPTLYVSYPAPVLGDAPACSTCAGAGVTGDQYGMEYEPGVLLVDVFCPACRGCGRANHATCERQTHCDWDENDGGRDDQDDEHAGDDQFCWSCRGPGWVAVQAWNDDADSKVLVLRMPCGCTSDRVEPAETAAPPVAPQLVDEAHHAISRALAEHERDGARLDMRVGPFTAFALVGALQLVLRRDDLGSVLTKVLTDLARQFQAGLADGPVPGVAELIELGFDEQHDVLADGRPAQAEAGAVAGDATAHESDDW